MLTQRAFEEKLTYGLCYPTHLTWSQLLALGQSFDGGGTLLGKTNHSAISHSTRVRAQLESAHPQGH